MSLTQDRDPIRMPLTLPSGATLKNRLAKAAMTEGLGDPLNRANERHVRLYRRWAGAGLGLLITGNVQVDRRHLERPGNVAIEGPQSAEAQDALRAWAEAAREQGAHVWMQISHAGRQTPKAVNPAPDAPSAVALKLPGGNFGRPRALDGATIRTLIDRFAECAAVAEACGFNGVQVHAAHGYLISQFLSPISNKRDDEWGGPLENRARFLLEVLKAVRARVAKGFAVGVKLNSADFQKGGFGHDDALQVVRWLNDAGVDLLEISGGNYEQPRMVGMGGVLEPVYEAHIRETTRAREAYFFAYAESVASVARMPVMVTGGLRTRAGMVEALSDGKVAVLGIGRPLCGAPHCTAALIEGAAEKLPDYEANLRLGPGWLGPNSPITLVKLINAFGAQGWYYQQLLRMGDGLDPDLKMGVFTAFRRYQADEAARAKALKR